MMIHPAHAMLLAKIRHGELLAEADIHRSGHAGPQLDCRVPAAEPRHRFPRSPRLSRIGRRGPDFALWGHRRVRRIR
jgi:hypothetical protein